MSMFRPLTLLVLLLTLTWIPDAASAQPEESRFSVGEGSQVSYHVNAKILGVFQEGIVGTNHRLRGEIRVTPSQEPQGWVEADVAGFESGLAIRDEHVAQILGAPRTPTIRFVLTRLEGYDASLEQGTATAQGVLTVGARNHTLRIPLHYQLSKGSLKLKGQVPVRFSDFGIEPPVVAGVIKRAPDELQIRVSLTANKVAR